MMIVILEMQTSERLLHLNSWLGCNYALLLRFSSYLLQHATVR